MIKRLLKNNFTKKLARGVERFMICPDVRFKKLSKRLTDERKILLSFREMYNLYDKVRKTAKLEGDIAELGVYSGGSAKLICEAKGDRALRLFDTFCGLPDNDVTVNKISGGEIRGASLAQVKDYLLAYNNVYFYEGIFPDSAVQLKDKLPRFSLVHLDADIYEATLVGLKFFYPLMLKKGIILIHDYGAMHLPGVKKAVVEFLKDKPEKVIELGKGAFIRFYPAVQAMIIKQ